MRYRDRRSKLRSLSVAEEFRADSRIERRGRHADRVARSFHALGRGPQVRIAQNGILDQPGQFRIAESANPAGHHVATAMGAAPLAGDLPGSAPASVIISAPKGGILSAQPASKKHAAVARRIRILMRSA